MSGRSKFRKTGGDDKFWAQLRERLGNPPPADPDTRFTVYDFIPIEANGVIALFNVVDVTTGLVLSSCQWRSQPLECVQLPHGIAIPAVTFHAALLASVREHARKLMTGDIT
jgi:hypothetical protein